MEYYTPAQSLALEEDAESKSEYLNSQIFATSEASYNHNLIVRNICGALTKALSGEICKAG